MSDDPWYESDEAYDAEVCPQDHVHDQWEHVSDNDAWSEWVMEHEDELKMVCLACMTEHLEGITFGGGIFYCSVKCVKAHGLDPREGAWTNFEALNGDEDE